MRSGRSGDYRSIIELLEKAGGVDGVSVFAAVSNISSIRKICMCSAHAAAWLSKRNECVGCVTRLIQVAEFPCVDAGGAEGRQME